METIINFKFILIPLMGYLVDHFVILGSTKRFYLIICGILGTIIYLLMAHSPHINSSV